MIAPEVIVYTFVCGAMLMLSVLGLESAVVSPSLDRWGKRFFIAYFAVLVLGSTTFFFEFIVYMYPALMPLEVVSYYFDSLLSVIPFPMLAVYLLHCCGEDWRTSHLFRAMLALWAVYFILVSFAQFTTSFYYIAPDNQQYRGSAYLLLIAPILAMLVLVAVGVFRRSNRLSRQYYRAFIICLLPVMLALIVHVFISAFPLIGIGQAISAYSMYRIIESDSIKQSMRQQQEIVSQRASIAMLQMRPHFIYNTMTSIYYLCDQDLKLAKQVTMDFTTYLRKNFNAIASEDTIPFSEELEHTRAYLAVEQAQFEDRLFVEYDTPHIQFRVPPLTLQPIVENAVKHGMDPDSDPLQIWIQARETDNGSEIVVEDNGSGFELGGNGEPHTALANIEQRLDMMCGGQLAIADRAGGGTVVKVTIPQRR